MSLFAPLRALFVAAALLAITAPLAQAQPKAEIGAFLFSSTIGLGNDNVTTVGIPSGGFGFSPGVYVSFFAGKKLAVEPQLGLVWASFDGDSAYLLNVVGQVDYFVKGIRTSSPYIFGAAGIVSQTDATYTPKSFGVGAGYRMPVGDRLTFRIDGRYTHYTGEFEGDQGDAVGFALSIGGIFGR